MAVLSDDLSDRSDKIKDVEVLTFVNGELVYKK